MEKQIQNSLLEQLKKKQAESMETMKQLQEEKEWKEEEVEEMGRRIVDLTQEKELEKNQQDQERLQTFDGYK